MSREIIMARVTVTRQVEAPVDEVWKSWDDFGNIYRFNPNLRHSQLLSDPDKPTGVGSERQCDFADGKNWIRERIVDYRPGKSIKIDIYDGTMPLKSMSGTLVFEEIRGGKTRIRMTVDFEPRMGVVGKLLTPLMRRQFRPMLQALLDCNAAHIERGDVVPAAA